MDDQIEDLEQAIREALTDALPNAEIRFDPYPGFGKLHPVIIWDGFQDEPFLDRQHFVWDILRRVLTDEQRFATGFLLLASHSEANVMEPMAA
jgi:hypothetical protein